MPATSCARRVGHLIAGLTCAVIACGERPAFAQISQAVVEGVVVDSSGLAVPGANVELINPATNQRRAVVTDTSGGFRLTGVAPSVYALRVNLAGFAPFEQHDLALSLGQTARVRVVLSPANVTESVSVSAQPPALDPSRTSVATVVDGERIEELPVRSRNYLEFVLLAPGVVRSQSGPGASGASSLPDSGFSFAGLRPRSNMLTIDGVDNNDEVTGSSRTELSLESVREFQVVNNGWSAESGGASGGAINVVTKSGTNILHGDAFLFGQTGHLNALPKLEDIFGVRPTLERYRGGLEIGGPLVKDRTFYEAAMEREQTGAQTASDTGSRGPSTVNSVLNSMSGLGTQRLTVGLFPTSLRETELAAKVVHQLSPRQSFMFRAAGTDGSESADAFNTGGLSDLSARGSSHTRDVALTGTWASVVGSRATNEVRGQVATRRVERWTTDRQGPGIVIPGVIDFGRPYAGNDQDRQTYTEAGDVFGVTGRHHFVKFGLDVTRMTVSGDIGDGRGGLYTFPTLDAFLNQQPDSARRTFGDLPTDFHATRTGLFVQDHWTPGPRLSVDAGVRWDGQTLPAAPGVTSRQLTPRAGFAWTPATNWVIRGGAGVFADRLVLGAFERALVLDGHRGFEQILESADAGAMWRAQQGAPPAVTASVAQSIYTVHPGAWRSSSRQASIGIERGLTADMTASVNYLFVQGRDLARTINTNLLPPATDSGRAVFSRMRRDSAWNDVFELQPSASSTYRGVTATINRRLAHEIEWTAAYTWSHARDTASDFDEQPQNPFALAQELADSRYDQRHRLVASALFDLPIGDEEDRKPGEVFPWWVRALSNIELAPIVTLGSGRPVNPIVGTDVSGSHAYPFADRPVGLARNSLRLPRSATLDLRLLKFFNVKPHGKLDLVVEAFNVLNRTNVTELNAVYGSGSSPLVTFGRAIEAASARHIQFSVDFEF